MLRDEAGLTQEELAERAGLSRPTLWEMEAHDNYSPRLETLQRVADALGVGLGRVVGVDPVPLSPVLQEIVEAARAMPPERQAMLADLARAVLFTAAMNRPRRGRRVGAVIA